MVELGRAKDSKKKTEKPTEFQHRPSFEIVEDYVELNFKPIIDADREASMTKRELRQRRRAEKKEQEKKQHHYLRNSIIAGVILVTIAITTTCVWWNNSTSPVNADDTATRQFVVDEGATTDEVAVALRKAGFIRSTLAFKLWMRWDGGIIQAGTHMLSPSFTMEEIATKLATADTDEIDVQISPGLTLSEIKEQLKKYDYTDSEIEAAFNATYDNEILADRPEGATLEGYLYPDTYRVYAGDDLSVVVEKALDRMAEVDEENSLSEGFAAQGLSFYEGITLASIVTKEVQNTDDQPIVASVFYNRLNMGMALGSDVTYKYAYKMGYCSINGPSCDSVYNTRLSDNIGLPPGPIANPTLSAMKATAYPSETNYLYFVAGEDGNTYFSETADQHNQAVAEHCGSLCEE